MLILTNLDKCLLVVVNIKIQDISSQVTLSLATAYAAKDGGNVIPVHLNASKLFDASTMSPLNKRNVSDQLVNRLKDEGYDGITGFRYPHEVVVFNPNG